MPTYTSYDTVGAKEDISDLISNITPTKTPFVSSLKTEKVHNRVFQWQEDSLRAVQVNAQVEGADATAATLVPTVMRSNNTQILEKTVMVSGTEDAIDNYGRAKESAYQVSKGSAEVKRDLENALVGVAQAAVAGDNSGPTARKMASAINQIDATTTITTITPFALTEANVLLADQALYSAGSEASLIMVKPADSLLVAGFANAAGRSRVFNDTQKTITNVVNIYVSPFGEKKVTINRFLKTSEAILYDPDYWRLVVLRNWFRETLAKTGDSTKMQLIGEFSLKHKNFKASARVTALV